MFATVNYLGMGTFSCLIPETKGRSLEEMDIIFGAVSAETRKAEIEQQEKGMQQVGADSLSQHSDGDQKV